MSRASHSADVACRNWSTLSSARPGPAPGAAPTPPHQRNGSRQHGGSSTCCESRKASMPATQPATCVGLKTPKSKKRRRGSKKSAGLKRSVASSSRFSTDTTWPLSNVTSNHGRHHEVTVPKINAPPSARATRDRPSLARPAAPARSRGCTSASPAPGALLLRDGSSGSPAAAPSGAARGEALPPPVAPAAVHGRRCGAAARRPGLAPAAAARAATGESTAARPVPAAAPRATAGRGGVPRPAPAPDGRRAERSRGAPQRGRLGDLTRVYQATTSTWAVAGSPAPGRPGP